MRPLKRLCKLNKEVTNELCDEMGVEREQLFKILNKEEFKRMVREAVEKEAKSFLGRRSFLEALALGAGITIGSIGLAKGEVLITNDNVIVKDPSTGLDWDLRVPLPFSAIVGIEGKKVRSYDWRGELIDSGKKGVGDTGVILSAIDSLTPNRTWKERVVLIGEFVVNDSVVIPSYIVFELYGKIKLADNTNKPPISLSSVAYVDIIGGIVDGNKAKQTSYPTGVRGVINIVDCENVNIYDTKVVNAYRDGIYVLFSTAGKKNVNLFNVIVESTNEDGIFYDTPNLDLNVDSTIFRPVIKFAGDNPINLSDLQGVTVYNPIIESPTSSLRIEDCQNIEIHRPIIRNPAGHGIVIESIRRGIGKNKIIGGEITSETASPNRGVYIKQSKENYVFGVTVYNFSQCFRVDSAGSSVYTAERNVIQSCIADTPGSVAFSTGGYGGYNMFLDCKVINLGTATAFSLALPGDKAKRYMIDGKPSWSSDTTSLTGDGISTTLSTTVTHGLVSDKFVARAIVYDNTVTNVVCIPVDADGDGFYESIKIVATFSSAPASGATIPVYWEAEVVG